MKFLNELEKIKEGLAGIVFPNVCLCCGRETVQKEKYLCSFCLNERFEYANTNHKPSSSGVILPDNVILQQALWQFDKGGDLQKLLHALKYNRLTSVGRQLGQRMAKRLRKRPETQAVLAKKEFLLVPVPLHYLKYRKRDFNQAFTIAREIEKVTGFEICGIDTVQQQKYTLSQTGFTLEKRIKNMENAFRVRYPARIAQKN